MSARTPRLLGLALLGVLAAPLGPGCISAKRQQRAAARVDVGVSMLRAGDHPGAVTKLREAVKLDPRNWRAWDKLGLAYSAQGAVEEAERAFVRATRLNPTGGEPHNNYGLFLLSQGRLEESVEAFETATSDLEYRRPALALSNLGLALVQLERHEEAIRHLDAAIERAPNLCQPRFHRGLASQALGRDEEALHDFEAVIGLCGEDALGAYVQAAPLLMDQGQVDAGCAYLGTVLAAAPSSELGRSARALREERCR